MATGIGGELVWLCPTLGDDDEDLTGLNTPSLSGDIASIAHADHGGTRAYSLDGTGDGIVIPHHTRFDFGAGDFTVSAHAKPATSGSADLVHKILNSGTFAGFTVQRFSGELRSWVYNTTGTTRTYRGIAIDAWSHVLLERRSGVVNGFVNGFCLNQFTDAQNVTNTRDLCVGLVAAGGWGGGDFSGLIDDVRVFGKALTATERGQLSVPGFQPISVGGGNTLAGIRRGIRMANEIGVRNG